jgi:hypothetical protein
MAQLAISASVGDVQPDGTPSPNLFGDTLVVQFLLNHAAPPKNPPAPLPLDGLCTPQVISAIQNFQSFFGPANGRIDPDDATMAQLNAIALPDFEGISDPLEVQSIILRPNPQWNFTRGDYVSLTQFAGLTLTFDPNSTWLPDSLKTRYINIFNSLLLASLDPAPTWGVSSLDWYHSHLGLWSGVANTPVSPAAKAWVATAVGLSNSIDTLRLPFLSHFALTAANAAAFSPVYRARLLMPDVAALLNAYAALPEAVIVHHTFENSTWRPTMSSDDVRRHWMVNAAGQVLTSPYRSSQDLQL